MLLQRAGTVTACLDAKRYAGGMASTVERSTGTEIAGSVVPDLPGGQQRVSLDGFCRRSIWRCDVGGVARVSGTIRSTTDPTKMLTHSIGHGADAVTGMAGLLAWSQRRPGRWGRFGSREPAQELRREACATNESSNGRRSMTCCSLVNTC